MSLRRLLSLHHFRVLILSLGLKKANGKSFSETTVENCLGIITFFRLELFDIMSCHRQACWIFHHWNKVINTNDYLMMFFQFFHVFPTIRGFFCSIRSWYVSMFHLPNGRKSNCQSTDSWVPRVRSNRASAGDQCGHRSLHLRWEAHEPQDPGFWTGKGSTWV